MGTPPSPLSLLPNRCTDSRTLKPVAHTHPLPPHSASSRQPVRRTSRSSWTRPRVSPILPNSTLMPSSISPEPQPTQLTSLPLSSSATSSELRSTTKSSTRPAQLPTQELSGPPASPSLSHQLPQAPSTIFRSTVLMLMATPSGASPPPSTSLDFTRTAIARQLESSLSKANDVVTFVQLF